MLRPITLKQRLCNLQTHCSAGEVRNGGKQTRNEGSSDGREDVDGLSDGSVEGCDDGWLDGCEDRCNDGTADGIDDTLGLIEG